MAWLWLPETVHRTQAGTGNPFRYLPELLRRPLVRRVLVIDFVYWFSFAIFQTTFALFTARRFGSTRRRPATSLPRLGVLGAVIQGGFIRPVVRRLGDKSTLMLGLACGAFGLLACGDGPLRPAVHAGRWCRWHSGSGSGIRRWRVWSAWWLTATSRAASRARRAPWRVSAARLARSGATSPKRFGEAAPYVSAATLLLLTLVLAAGFQVTWRAERSETALP